MSDKSKKHDEEELERELEQTFPASDAPSITQPHEAHEGAGAKKPPKQKR